MEMIIMSLMMIGNVILSAIMANKRNRNVGCYAFLGLLFGVFTMIALAFLGEKE